METVLSMKNFFFHLLFIEVNSSRFYIWRKFYSWRKMFFSGYDFSLKTTWSIFMRFQKKEKNFVFWLHKVIAINWDEILFEQLRLKCTWSIDVVQKKSIEEMK